MNPYDAMHLYLKDHEIGVREVADKVVASSPLTSDDARKALRDYIVIIGAGQAIHGLSESFKTATKEKPHAR